MTFLRDLPAWRGLFGPNFRRVFGYLRPVRGRLLLFVPLALLNLPLSLIEPFILMYLVDRILLAGRPELLLPFALRIFPLFLIGSALGFLLTYTLLKMARDLHVEIKANQLDNLIVKPIAFFKNNAAGQILYSFFNDSNSIGALLTLGLLGTAMNLLYAIVRIGILAYIDPLLTLAYLAVVPFQVLLMWRMMKIVMRLEIDIKRRDEDLTARIESLLRGAVVVKSFGFGGALAGIWKRLFGTRLDVDLKNLVWRQLGGLGVTNIQAVGVFAVLFLGVHRVAAGDLTLGTVLAFMSIAGGVTPSLHALVGFLVGIQDSLVNIERFYRVYDVPEERESFARARITGGTRGDAEIGAADLAEIHLRDVVVEHGDGRILRIPCDFAMRRGESVLWYGPNGTGKTSLALALAALIPHAPGSIQCGDRPLAAFHPASVRRRILYLPSEPFWPERTLAQNFVEDGSGSPPALDAARLEQSLWLADAESVLASLPLGMETVLSSDAHVLSRGENQRLFLAMALYRRPPVMIFDEALSQVATRNVRRVLERIASSRLDAIVVHVSQRATDHEACARKIAFGSAT